MKETDSSSNRGRPMSPEVHEAILEAASTLLETQSVGDLTIKGVASAAGVTRPTIYRRWSTATEIALEAFLSKTERQIPVLTTVPFPDALRAHIKAMVKFMAGRGGQLACELIGDSQRNSEVLDVVWEKFLDVRRQQAVKLFERGIDDGYVNPNADLDFAIDLYAGPVYYRALTGRLSAKSSLWDPLTDSVLEAVKP